MWQKGKINLSAASATTGYSLRMFVGFFIWFVNRFVVCSRKEQGKRGHVEWEMKLHRFGCVVIGQLR